MTSRMRTAINPFVERPFRNYTNDRRPISRTHLIHKVPKTHQDPLPYRIQQRAIQQRKTQKGGTECENLVNLN